MISSCYKVFLKCLFYLLQLMGLFLPVEFIDLTLHESKFWIFKQIYAVIISILLILSYGYIQWLGTHTIYKVQRTSNIILLVLTLTSFIIICLLSILGNAFWNKERWGHYLKLQRILKTKMKLKLNRNSLYFCLEFVFGHLALFLVVSIDQWSDHELMDGYAIDIRRKLTKLCERIPQKLHYLFDVSRLTQILFVILKDSLLYYIFLITIIIYNALLQLKNHFNSVRTFITNTVGLEDDTGQFTLYRPLEGTITFPATVISDKTLFGLVEASKILSILFECVDIFNQLFGLVIMFINMSTVLTILTSLNTLLVSGETNQLTTEVVLDCIFEALLFLVWNSSILSASGLLKEESSEIVKICCKLQHLLPQSSQERKELLNLAHQIRRKSVTVSASGFFDVDFILILAVFTYVGNYIVVLIQFSHMDF